MNEPMEVAFAPDRLAVLLKHFAELNDERESWRVAYASRACTGCSTSSSRTTFRVIARDTAPRMAVVRRFALDLVRAHRKVKGSVKRRRKLASWDPEFLLQILGPFPDFTGKGRFASRTASRDRCEWLTIGHDHTTR
jgi:hypothetical protein